MGLPTSISAWDDITDRYQGASLRLGNGFSISIDLRFEGNFLALTVLEKAHKGGQPSTVGEILIELNETNIESALASLALARSVVGVSAADSDAIVKIEKVETELRRALLVAIHAVHPEHAEVVDELRRRAPALYRYAAIFTTNFDVLLYWMVMASDVGEASAETDRLVDLFWNRGLCFGPLSVTPSADQIPVYYLHGALHFVRDSHNATGRHVGANRADPELNIIDLLGFEDARSFPHWLLAWLPAKSGCHERGLYL